MHIDERLSNFMALLASEPKSMSSPSEDSTRSLSQQQFPPVTVALSTSALQQSEDEARRERLNAIRRQLEDGSYNISGKDVAEKMLRVLKN